MRKIVVVPHENHWGEKFQMEAERLKAAMPEKVKVIILEVHRCQDWRPKPIIDMIMEVESIDRVDRWNERFEELGYIVKGENGISRRRYFIHGTEEKRSYHLHVFEKGNPEIVRHLAFRDYMMAHCEEAEAYATLKKELAEKYTYDGALYSEGKTEFVRNVDEKAKKWIENNVNE